MTATKPDMLCRRLRSLLRLRQDARDYLLYRLRNVLSSTLTHTARIDIIRFGLQFKNHPRVKTHPRGRDRLMNRSYKHRKKKPKTNVKIYRPILFFLYTVRWAMGKILPQSFNNTMARGPRSIVIG
jgi:hypothetical protein